MKKYKRQPEKFEVFDLFSSLGPEWNLQFNDENSIRKFCEGMASSLRRYTTPIMLYGRHVESMGDLKMPGYTTFFRSRMAVHTRRITSCKPTLI